MEYKYKVIEENGAYYEVLTFEEVPQGAIYERIEIHVPTDEEIAETKRPMIQEIDDYYTELISKLFRKPMEKLAVDEITEIPQDIKNERDRLRAECNQKISAIGVDIDVYRKSKRETIKLI